jgi:hypothetical protein
MAFQNPVADIDKRFIVLTDVLSERQEQTFGQTRLLQTSFE